MKTSEAAGYAFVAAAILTSGSFLVPYRFIYPGRFAIHPVIFHLYTSFGIFLAHWLSQAFLPLNPDFVHDGSSKFHFSLLGVVAGGLVGFGLVLNFASTAKIGMALTQAISAGATVLSSYIWATVLFDEVPSILWLSIFGICLIVIGIGVISAGKHISHSRDQQGKVYKRVPPQQDEEAKEERPKFSFEGEEILFGGKGRDTNTTLEDGGSITESLMSELHKQAVWVETRQYLEGITYAVLSGIVGGSVLAPLHYVPHGEKGLAFLPSFACAALFCAPMIILLYLLNPIGSQKQVPALYFYETFGLSVLSGMVWSVSNICAIGAIDRLGYGVAFPLIQLSILVAALWGFLCFGELRERDGGIGGGVCFYFAMGAGLLIVGAVFLAIAK